MPLRRLVPVVLLLAACNTDIGVTQNAICDGVLQPGEDTVDSPFDLDGDGYFNAVSCEGTYPDDQLDCDDAVAEVNPGENEITCDFLDNDCDDRTPDGDDLDEDGWNDCDDCNDLNPDVYPANSETPCNGIDDDCDEGTPDETDFDGDGFTTCTDCDDSDPYVNPESEELTCNDVDDDCNAGTLDYEAQEVCDDGVDNNCNGYIDEDCEFDVTGTWFLDKPVEYSCAWGYVELAFQSVDIVFSDPNIQIEGDGTKGQPGKTLGTLENDFSFQTSRKVSGGCTEEYIFAGSFSDSSTADVRFTAKYTGGQANCGDCKTRSWPQNGTMEMTR